jgi:hypothetical protein
VHVNRPQQGRGSQGAQGSIKVVAGTFVVQKPSVPAGGSLSSEYAALALVGIDGSKCTSSFFQAGVQLSVMGLQVGYLRKSALSSE